MIKQHQIGHVCLQGFEGNSQKWNLLVEADEHNNPYRFFLRYGLCAEKEVDDPQLNLVQIFAIEQMIHDWMNENPRKQARALERASLIWGPDIELIEND